MPLSAVCVIELVQAVVYMMVDGFCEYKKYVSKNQQHFLKIYTSFPLQNRLQFKVV